MRIQRLTKRDKAGFVTVVAVRVLYGGVRQNFAPDMLAGAMREGWARIRDDEVQLKGEADVVYRYSILRRPGTYCCYCHSQLDRDEVQTHLRIHKGPSPDKENPSGYRIVRCYECMRI